MTGGFIATPDDSLEWLFPLGDIESTSYPAFIRDVGALAMGSATYEWMLRHVVGVRDAETLEGATVVSLRLYDRVALKVAVQEHGLRPGDVATLVDLVGHPSGGPQGCVLEVFNALGESIAVVAVSENAVEALRADEVLSVRPLAIAG